MDFKTGVFYVLAALLVASALRVITAKNPVHASLALVLSFFTAGALWMLLEAEFLAISLVLVYVGAVMVLFLFVVMMLDINIERLRQGFWANLIPGLFVGGMLLFEMLLVVSARYFNAESMPAPLTSPDVSNTTQLGRVLYTDYVYPFELAAVILLVAIIAAIALTMRRRGDSRAIDPAAQVAVKAADRVRLVSMPAEKE